MLLVVAQLLPLLLVVLLVVLLPPPPRVVVAAAIAKATQSQTMAALLLLVATTVAQAWALATTSQAQLLQPTTSSLQRRSGERPRCAVRTASTVVRAALTAAPFPCIIHTFLRRRCCLHCSVVCSHTLTPLPPPALCLRPMCPATVSSIGLHCTLLLLQPPPPPHGYSVTQPPTHVGGSSSGEQRQQRPDDAAAAAGAPGSSSEPPGHPPPQPSSDAAAAAAAAGGGSDGGADAAAGAVVAVTAGGGSGDLRVPSNIDVLLCEVCSGGHAEHQILLCDGCDAGIHMFCLSPPLDKVPAGEWLCPHCLAARCAAAGRPVGELSWSELATAAAASKRAYWGTDARARKVQHACAGARAHTHTHTHTHTHILPVVGHPTVLFCHCLVCVCVSV
jgi:PHD-finger